LGCQPTNWNKALPFSQELGSNRGKLLARTITHLHSPLSYDACDSGNSHCLEDLRAALCINHVDFAFITDHVKNMATTDFDKLHLSIQGKGDQPISKSGTTIGNQFTCDDAQKVKVMAGYEDQLMPIGMTSHLDPDQDVRTSLYGQSNPTIVAQLQTQADALVIVPHTESRENSDLVALNVNGIEIYNLHANINPLIRTRFLGFDHFSGIIDLSIFWVDPFGRQKPDLAFMSFLSISPVYAQKWNYLISQGQHVTGIAGNDSHQNFFPGLANDGDRVDSHRRLIRWVLNYFLVEDMELDSIKASIKKGRGWIVFEGLGTPVGVDFYATDSSTTAEVGDTLSFQADHTNIHISIPTLHSSSPQSGPSPIVVARLKRVDSSGNEQVVASSVNTSLDFSVKEQGSYRAEIGIVPLHLFDFMGYKKTATTKEMPWLISNHIYIQ
jgi:hypothetical protein